MKRISYLILVVILLCLCLPQPAIAAEKTPLLVDNANLLSDSQERTLLSKLEHICADQQMDIVIVTTVSLYGKSPRDFADDFYDDHGYASDGILLLVSMEDSDWYISTSGYGITAVTDAGREYMADQFVDLLSDGDYYNAFVTYADLCDDFIDRARSGDPFDKDDLPKEKFQFGKSLLISFGVGLLVALIVTGCMRAGLKSVRSRPEARNYVKTNSMRITNSRDLFLYRHISRRPKPKSHSAGGSRIHVSSSGRSHGGGGGKF